MGQNYLREELDYWVLVAVTMAIVALICMTVKGAAFGFIGENITLKIRKVLYNKLLEKEIGFYDFRQNKHSVLTQVLAEDASIINEANSEISSAY